MTVSIIIPVFKVSDYVERCLLSVIKQDYSYIECIIVDDCSPDDSIVKSKRLIDGYVGPIRFKILHHKRNRGLSAARNTGTDAATGDYIFYLDSDDEITADCISKLASPILCNDTIELVQGNYKVHRIGGKQMIINPSTGPIRITTNEGVRELYHNYHILHVVAWNKLMKLSFIKDNGICFKEGLIYEDSLWMFYLLKYLKNVYVLNDVTYNYYVRPCSISTGTCHKEKGEAFSQIFKVILDQLTEGKEVLELNNNLQKFIDKFLSYKNDVPDYCSVMTLYRGKAKKYHCYYAYFTLCIVVFVGHFEFLQKVGYILNNILWNKENTHKKRSFNLFKNIIFE